MAAKTSIFGMILVSLAALSWSTAGLFTRIVTTDLPTTLFWRSAFGAVAVFMIYIVRHRPKSFSLVCFNRGEIVLAFVSGTAMCFFVSAFFYTSIANVSFVYGASPLVVVMGAWLLLKEQPASITFVAAIASGIGVAILAWGGQNFSDIFGLLLAGIMTLLMASIAVLAKYFPDADAGKATYLSGLIAALLMAPFVTNYTPDLYNVIWLFLYGIVNVGLGFGLYLLGAARVTPATTAMIGLLEVVLAPLWAFWLFDEGLTVAMLIGGTLITAAALTHIWATYR